jgi:PilZ domain-containing protein
MFAYVNVSTEQRKYMRLPVSLTAHCQLGSRFVRDTLTDLSEHGLFLRTTEPAQEGTAVRVALALPYADGLRFCTLTGNVVRVQRSPTGEREGLAIRFDENVASFDRDMLKSFLSLWGSRRLGLA